MVYTDVVCTFCTLTYQLCLVGVYDINVTPDKRVLVLQSETYLFTQIIVNLEEIFGPSRTQFTPSEKITSVKNMLTSIGPTQSQKILSTPPAAKFDKLSQYLSSSEQSYDEAEVKEAKRPKMSIVPERETVELQEEDSVSVAEETIQKETDIADVGLKAPSLAEDIAWMMNSPKRKVQVSVADIRARLTKKKRWPAFQSVRPAGLSEMTNVTKSDFQKMRIIGQFNLGFIMGILGDKLFIIDQHARYVY